jgi:cold shock CspA family protein/ribosome-associated translation inhibitor RaiA
MMQIPLQVVARGLELDESQREAIQSRTAKLEMFFGRILGCRVTVRAPNRFAQAGPIEYRVRIDLTLPGQELVIKRQPNAHLLDAIQDAFDVAGRRIQDYVRRLPPANPPEAQARPDRARVSRLLPWEGYGFLETGDGRELYFHRHSVLNDAFDRLEVGMEVHFAEEEGDKGPQASSLSIAGRRSGAAHAAPPGGGRPVEPEGASDGT